MIGTTTTPTMVEIGEPRRQIEAPEPLPQQEPSTPETVPAEPVKQPAEPVPA